MARPKKVKVEEPKEIVEEQVEEQVEVTADSVLQQIDQDKDGTIEVGEAVTYILHSRTIWVNAVALAAMFIQGKYGFIIDQALQTEILLVLNMWLRTKTTKPVAWNK